VNSGSIPELRPYQQEAINAIRRAYQQGRRRVLVSLPTGTGKTVIFAGFPGAFRMKRRLLVLAHRQELLEQAADKFRAIDPTLQVAIEQAERRAGDARVVIASVPSLRGARLRALAPEDFYLVVVDEAHHAVAKSYRAIFDHLGLFAPDNKRLLVGFTATPRRGDRQPLGEVFEEIVFSKGLEEMITAGYLCRVAGWRVRTDVDLDGVKVQHGDFVEAQLADAVNVEGRNEVLVNAYQKLAAGRRCIVFCANVEHAQTVAAVFRADGLAAEAVWGTMPRDERAAVLDRFHSGTTAVVTNCNLLTEGFDEPRVDCVLMARPTKSLLLYAQMVGRGTRLAPGKTDLLVIDVADNSRRHTLAGLHQLFELPDSLDLRGADALHFAARLRQVRRDMPWVDITQIRAPEDLELVAERIDLFRFEPPEPIADATDLAWLGTGDGGLTLVLPGGIHYDVQPTLLGDWEITTRARDQQDAAVMHRAPEVESAVRWVDDRVRRHHRDALAILSRDAAWRDLAPTSAQVRRLELCGLKAPEGLTRGQASWMLSYLLKAAPSRSA
jgi:superfamily II DNA or RNA helicase